MAETKIKVNELPIATPTLTDTLLGSNAIKEYACKIEDLAELIGTADKIVTIAPEQEISVSSGSGTIELVDGAEIDENLWMLGLYDVCVNGQQLNFQCVNATGMSELSPISLIGFYRGTVLEGSSSHTCRVDIYSDTDATLTGDVVFSCEDPGTYVVSIELNETVANDPLVLKPVLFDGNVQFPESQYAGHVRTFTLACYTQLTAHRYLTDTEVVAGIRVDSSLLNKISALPVVRIHRAQLVTAYATDDIPYSEAEWHKLKGLLIPVDWGYYINPHDLEAAWRIPFMTIPHECYVRGLECVELLFSYDNDTYAPIISEGNRIVLFPDDVEVTPGWFY